MSGKMVCRNCRFWAPINGPDSCGECRRHAPTLYEHDGFTVYPPMGRWPGTNPSDGCGEWRIVPPQLQPRNDPLGNMPSDPDPLGVRP